MTLDDAKSLLRRVVAAWPVPEMGEDTSALWIAEFLRLDVEIAEAARQQLVRSGEQFAPSLSVFRAAYDAEARHRAFPSAGFQLAALPPADQSDRHEIVARCRARLEDAGVFPRRVRQ